MNDRLARQRKIAVAICGGICVLAATYAGYRLWDLTNTGAPQVATKTLSRLLTTQFADTASQSRTLDSFRGKVLVVNFWATWCPPCRQEMPAFSRLQDSLGPRGVQFVGIGIDSPSAIREFALQTPVSYPLLAGGTAGMELMRELGNSTAALPFTFVLRSDGQPAFSHLGMLTEGLLEERLLRLTEERPLRPTLPSR